MVNIIFIMKQGNNVIMVNWSQAANLTNYAQARADARVVGFQVAKVMADIVQNTDAAYDQMHLIGGGMGAHVAGYAGSTGEKVARITGNMKRVFFFFLDLSCSRSKYPTKVLWTLKIEIINKNNYE